MYVLLRLQLQMLCQGLQASAGKEIIGASQTLLNKGQVQ